MQGMWESAIFTQAQDALEEVRLHGCGNTSEAYGCSGIGIGECFARVKHSRSYISLCQSVCVSGYQKSSSKLTS